jgi:polyphenol oxidase
MLNGTNLGARAGDRIFVSDRRDTRRQFLGRASLVFGGLTALGVPGGVARADEPTDCTPPAPSGPPVNFTPDTSLSVRTRKSAAKLLPAEVDRLKSAYAALRKLTTDDPNDPRGWLQQANMHCWYCSGTEAMPSGQEIHGSWWFFPWHRCYLYFHERILGKLIGDMSLALPYWDWFNATHRRLPDLYTTPNDSSNSLFDMVRGTTPTSEIPDRYVGTTAQDRAMNAPNAELFLGTGASLPTASGGSVENGPHGAVHLWVGNPSNLHIPKPDMGVLATAAQDPVFFAHHTNIDRLWEVWRNSDSSHMNPTSNVWKNQRFNFYDENCRWTSIAVADVVDFETNLRYKYEDPEMSPAHMLVLASPAQEIPLGTSPMTIAAKTIPAPIMDKTKSQPASALAKRARLFVLHIDGIEVPPERSAVVRVFVNRPDANAATEIDTPLFAGYFTVLAKSTKAPAHAMKKHRAMNVAFDLTPRIGEILRNRTDLSVTLVPVGAEDSAPSDIKLTFKKVYLTVDE